MVLVATEEGFAVVPAGVRVQRGTNVSSTSGECKKLTLVEVIMSKPLNNDAIRETGISFKGMKPALKTGVYPVLNLNEVSHCFWSDNTVSKHIVKSMKLAMVAYALLLFKIYFTVQCRHSKFTHVAFLEIVTTGAV